MTSTLSFILLLHVSTCIQCIKHHFRNDGRNKATDRQTQCSDIHFKTKIARHNSMTQCPSNHICRKQFQVSIIQNLLPYSSYPIKRVIEHCCGVCTNLSPIKYLQNITELTPRAINQSDFILPLLGSSTYSLHGYHFIPVVRAPLVVYISVREKPILQQVFKSCLQLYPLIVVLFLLTLISGFIVWLIERRNNECQFPRSLLVGWFEGIWYSFISVSTVGYGDKIPKSYVTRLFCVFWIMLGIAMISIFTAMLSADVLEANQTKKIILNGVKVGVLKFRSYDANIATTKGGKVIESDGVTFQTDILQLAVMLRRREIQGMLLDRYTHRYACKLLQKEARENKNDNLRLSSEFFVNNTRVSEIGGEPASFWYGILVKHGTDFEFFHRVYADQRLTLEGTMLSKINVRLDVNHNKAQSGYSGFLFVNAIKVLSGIIGVICIFGFCFELCRRFLVNGGDAIRLKHEHMCTLFFN